MRTVAIIPAFNEEESLPLVLRDIPWDRIEAVQVVDNGSTDGTAEVGRTGGARVIHEPRRGYGAACLAGIRAVAPLAPDVVVFLDADYSDHPEETPALLDPIERHGYDLVIGSRVRGRREPGALPPQARLGNLLAVHLIRLLFGFRYSDLGPFRALRWDALERMEMRDPAFGWTVEMQIRALQNGLAVTEVPVRYRRRIGMSKISGTLRGSLAAGLGILGTIARLRCQGGAAPGCGPRVAAGATTGIGKTSWERSRRGVEAPGLHVL